MNGSYYLDTVEDFAPAGKVYGDTMQKAERILNTFHSRPSGTGVLLVGEKGSGKTLLARVLSVQAREEGISTIIINRAWHGDVFNLFIQTIEEPAVIIFDEFEKVYEPKEQASMLTLLDGVYPSKKLYILTSNSPYRIDENMQNRPGRVFYRIDYTGVDQSFIREYCADNLEDETQVDAICRIALLFSNFNFDILKALIEEMNRYGESAQESIGMLNANPSQGDGNAYEVSVVIDGVKLDVDGDFDIWTGNPLGATIFLAYSDPETRVYTPIRVTPSDIETVDIEAGIIFYRNSDGNQVTLKRINAKIYNWKAAV